MRLRVAQRTQAADANIRITSKGEYEWLKKALR
jgi:hypothetical protein